MCILTGLIAGLGTALGIGASGLASATIGGIGALNASNQQANFYDMQNEALAQNSAVIEVQKRNAREKGLQDQRSLFKDFEQTKGTGRATMGANGVVLGAGGSATDWENNLNSQYSSDKQNMLHNQAMEQWQYDVNKTNMNNQMNINSYAADASLNAGKLNSFGNALNGINSAAGGAFKTYKSFQKVNGKNLFNFG